MQWAEEPKRKHFCVIFRFRLFVFVDWGAFWSTLGVVGSPWGRFWRSLSGLGVETGAMFVGTETTFLRGRGQNGSKK